VRQIFDTQDQPPYGQRIRHQLKRVLPNLSFKFESLRADKLAVQYAGPEYGYAYPEWELKLLEGENFARYRHTIQEVAALVQQMNLPSFLITLPHFPCREYFRPRYAPVLKEWEAAGMMVDETLEQFVERYGDVPPTGPEALQWGIDPADSHPGPKATHFHAVMAADYLEAHWPELLGPKDERRPHELVINDWLPFDLNVQQIGEQTFELDYPGTTELMYQPPGEPPTALIALRYPLPLKSIRLEAAGLMNLRVWVSTLHPGDPYDELLWHELKLDEADRFTLPHELAGRSVAEVRFRGEILKGDRRLQLTLTRPADATERP
jgi:hypothetical protein